MTWVMRWLGRRVGALDSAGVPGQIKAPRRAIPNTGGVAIFLGIALPMLAALVLVNVVDEGVVARYLPALTALPSDTGVASDGGLGPASSPGPGRLSALEGIRERTDVGLILLACLGTLHLVGLLDDRRPLGPYVKLGLQFIAAAIACMGTQTRLLSMLDIYTGGPWLSIAITVLWIVVITNAMNFMDNMDGLSAGVGCIAAGFFLAATLQQGQWFVAAALALLVGSLLGFLRFNFPRKGGATIFMGDGGSLVLGFMLAFLTVRTTYVFPTGLDSPEVTGVVENAGAFGAGRGLPASGAWYAVFMPVVVMALPLYDFVSVTILRLRQGKSPFVGDLQHFSHRLVQRGLSRRSAVVVIYGFTAVAGIGGVSLASLQPWQAILVGVQTLLVLTVLAIFERASSPNNGGGQGGRLATPQADSDRRGS
ncbi:MAG: MraY family glycosyltransferase [Planctomycetota bacterium]|nr:MraY family glycosyltransferase [Planctomycetota bacterium]